MEKIWRHDAHSNDTHHNDTRHEGLLTVTLSRNDLKQK
jgi:hypothetical protein